MNLSTVIVLVIVVALLILAVRSFARDESDCAHCGADCGSKNCASCAATKKLLADIERTDAATKNVEM
ncbi:MAG: hypothetical protein J5804_02490 [Eggerthellaceae bacterium]|nr:hypothetical protein [Eggerthellaceae bacterium]